MTISTEQVKINFGNAKILKGIDFNVEDKEFVGIIGPNGSGKSTFLKCLYRIIPDYLGSIFLQGKPIESYSFKQSAKEISVVAQQNHYSFEFKVKDILLMGRAPYKSMFDKDTEEDYQRVKDALSLVGMEKFEDRMFSTLSGGEQQRIILARALCQDTPILILDEPTNNLDIKYQLYLMDLLKKLDKTIISVIHDLDIASIYCDKIFVLKEGKIVALGPPNEVLTKELIREVYEVNADIFTDSKNRHRIIFQPEV